MKTRLPHCPRYSKSVHHRIIEVGETSGIPKSNHPPSMPTDSDPQPPHSHTGMEPSIHVAPALPPSSCSGPHLPSQRHRARFKAALTAVCSNTDTHYVGLRPFFQVHYSGTKMVPKSAFSSQLQRSSPAVLCSTFSEQRGGPGRSLPSGKPSLPSAHPALLHRSTHGAARGAEETRRAVRSGGGRQPPQRSARSSRSRGAFSRGHSRPRNALRRIAVRGAFSPRSSVTGALGSITRR